MTIHEMSVKIAELLQFTSDNPLLTVLPAYITQAQQVLKEAGVKDTVAESEKAVGAIMRGALDLWNFSAGDGKFSPAFFQMAEQLKYNDGVNGKLILSVSFIADGLYFNFTDGTRSEVFKLNGNVTTGTGATEEQLKQIQSNTDNIEKISDKLKELETDNGNIVITYDKETEALTIEAGNNSSSNISYNEETEALTIGGA